MCHLRGLGSHTFLDSPIVDLDTLIPPLAFQQQPVFNAHVMLQKVLEGGTRIEKGAIFVLARSRSITRVADSGCEAIDARMRHQETGRQRLPKWQGSDLPCIFPSF
jgi:hypothetical protein